jgi:hypothetical protein
LALEQILGQGILPRHELRILVRRWPDCRKASVGLLNIIEDGAARPRSNVCLGINDRSIQGQRTIRVTIGANQPTLKGKDTVRYGPRVGYRDVTKITLADPSHQNKALTNQITRVERVFG